MEWLEAHARLEQKRKSVLRRQQRDVQKKKREAEAREKELQKLAARCREMEQEEHLSVAMEAYYRDEEERKRLELQRLEDWKLFETISKTRKRTTALGLSVSTPGASGLQRLRLLEARIMEKELSVKKSREAKLRLDALPAKRSKLTQLMHSFFSSSMRKKVEHAVYHLHWDRLVPLFDPATASSGNRSSELLNHESENGFTPVLVAIFKGKLRVLRELLELGASPNTETAAGMTPLLASVMTGDVVALSILVEFKAELDYETKHNVNAVLLAADKGREEVLRALLEHGANVDGVNAAGRSSLIQAAISGNAGLFRTLLAFGASKELRDCDGKAALDWATHLHNSTMVSTLNSSLTNANLLAQLKAEEDDEDGEVLSSLSTNRVIQRSRTAALERAMRDADLDRLRELLSSEAAQLSPNYEDVNGNSPLLVACSKGTCTDVEFLLKSNCIATHQNRKGVNALMVACKRGDPALMQLLMKCGCNLVTRDFSGHDAFHYLNSYDHPDLAIELTNKFHKQKAERNPGLVLGNIVSSTSFLKSEYSISLTQAEISFRPCSASDDSSRSVDETVKAESTEDEEEGEPTDDPVIRQWGIKQETLKRDRQRRQRYDKEREQILAARTRGRRNGLIAPLSSDPAGRLKFPTCDNCKQSRARKRCAACDQVLCDKCHARLHELAHRRHHEYEELKPELYVGTERQEVFQTNQEKSLQFTVKKSSNCVAEMRSVLRGDEPGSQATLEPQSVDPEVENYQRKKRIAKEKAISQMQINVPVVAAKHAAQAGEETIFAQPAELELAALYTTQKKYEKALELLRRVEELVTSSLGILHPTMLKVAIAKARISQDTSQFAQCTSAMQDVLALFEGVLPLDHKDVLTATSMLLQSLDVTERYHEAVRICRRVYSIRVRALPSSHKSLAEIQEQLNEFISKREVVDMGKEDLVTLEKIEQERKRVEQLANESDKHLESFRHLLMKDPEGLTVFLTFARQEFAEDLVTFWISIEEFKEDDIDSKTLRSRAVSTYLNYIKSRRIKVITAAQRKKIKKAITTPSKKIPRTLYDDVQTQIFELVYTVYKSLAEEDGELPTMPTTWGSPLRSHARRYSREDALGGYTSPPSSDLSSDDEVAEYTSGATFRARPTHGMGRKINRVRRPAMATAFPENGAKHYGSAAHLSRVQRQPRDRTERLVPSRRGQSGEVFVTTMDEDDQQMFIALFFWRRKVIEAHFSAWKWVVFTLRRSSQQIHRQTRPSKPLSDYDAGGLHPRRRNLILKRHTGRSSAEESENNRGNIQPIAPRIHQMEDTDLPGPKAHVKDVLVDQDIAEKRQQFRTKLRLVYACFGQWKTNVEASRKKRVQQLVHAADFHRTQLLSTCFRAWQSGGKSLKLKRKRLEDADRFHWSHTRRFVFQGWKRRCRVEREISRRRNVNAARQQRLAFQHWCQCILQTHHCRKFAAKRCHNYLRIVFRSFGTGVLLAKQERLKSAAAVAHYQDKQQETVIRLWRIAVFENPYHLQLIDRGQRIGLSSGIRKWRRFMLQRQKRSRKVLLADFFRYRTRLRRAFRGWSQFLEWRRQRHQNYDEARGQYETRLKRCGIYRLQAAALDNRARRCQVRMATRWYQRKLSSRSFEVWVKSARERVRLNTFRRAVSGKMTRRVFLEWKVQTQACKRLRTQRDIVSKRWNGLLLDAAMAKWVRMARINSLLSSLELKRRNLSTARHFRAWQNWSETKTSHRSIVEQRLLRRDQALLQCVVSKWFGVTLRKRCLNRLVKLFRKKQSRARGKFLFRLWRVHVRVSIATRKRDLDRARLAMVEWKQVCRSSKHKRMMLAVASQYYRERRYVLAVKLWSSFARSSTQSRRNQAKALRHYFRHLLVKSLQQWYIAAREHRRQTEFLRHCRHLLEQRAAARCLHAWLALVRLWIESKAQEWTAIQFQVGSRQRRAFAAWIQFLEARRASYEKNCFAIATYEDNLRGSALRAWYRTARRKTEYRRKCSLFRASVKQKRLQASVAHWFTFLDDRRRHRKQISVANKFYNDYLLCLAMFNWQAKWSQASTLRRKETNATRQLHARRLSKALFKWHEKYQFSSSVKAKWSKASRFHCRKTLARRLGLWQSYHRAVRHKVSKRRLVTRVRQQKILSRMFGRWKQFTAASRYRRARYKEAVQHSAQLQLRVSFTNWKRYRSKRTLHIAAYLYRRKLLLQKFWLGWKLRCEHVAQVRQNILVASQLLRCNLSRSTFAQWKLYASCRQRSKIQRYRAEDHHVHWLYKRAVARMRKLMRFQQAVVKAATLGRINGARHHWRCWSHFVAAKRRKRSLRSTVEQTYLRNHKKQHFTAWKMRTKRCVQGRKAQSDALYRVSCLKMVWHRWQRAISWRRCIAAMECRRTEGLQAAILRRWQQHVRRQAEWKALKARAIEFQRSNLRAKTWRAWLEYVAYCHEKQRQLAWVLSYYSVEVLLRQSLSAWKKLVVLKQEAREKDELAAAFNTHRLVRSGHHKWNSYVEARKATLEYMECQLRKMESLTLSRSIRKWRNRAVVQHHQHRNESLSTRFHCRKQLKRGLDQLRGWRDSQKSVRDLTAQAKRYSDEKAVATYFRCWVRYHQWRAKHAHLTRVLQRNQTTDAFGHWKLYWQKRQSANEKRLQARVFHCIRVEQAVLALWGTFVRTQKQLTKARGFHTASVLQSGFSFWRHRAHVLRQMRRMFRFQEVFRAQTHFDAWKRLVVARKQHLERLRRAMKFKDNLRKLDVWQKWSAWVLLQQQERTTIALAVGFRQRFSTRKSFAVWRARAAYWKRERGLRDRALLLSQKNLLRLGFHLLVIWRQSKRNLRLLQAQLVAQLAERRKRRVIANLRVLCVESDRKRDLIQCACHHWRICHQQKYWGRVLQWFNVAKYRKRQRIQADVFARAHLLQRCVSALQAHLRHSKQVKAKIDAFRCRYFRSAADDGFYQWKAFVTFKQKLRVLRRRMLQSKRRQRLHQWHQIAVEQVRRRAGMQQLAVKRRQRELVAWFNHWESVCTDLWLEKELVAHHQRHAQKQRMLRVAVKTLQSQLPARHERQQRKSFYLSHHRGFLVRVLHHWHQAATSSTCWKP